LSVWCSPWVNWPTMSHSLHETWRILEATCLWRKLVMTYDESSLNLVTSKIHWLNYWTPWCHDRWSLVSHRAIKGPIC
jgi:hypothetical protein